MARAPELAPAAVPARARSLFVVALSGSVWSLALARVLAESVPRSPTLELPATLILTVAGAAASMGLGLMVVRGRADPVGLQRSSSLATSPEEKTVLFLPLLLAGIYLFWPAVAPQVGSTLLIGGLALAVLMSGWMSGPVLARSGVICAVAGCVALGIYLFTLGPTVGEADTFEFQVVAPTLGVAHPTGYPLYILSGKLFSLLPLGSVAWRVNLTSAVFAALVVVLLQWLISHLTGRPLVALVAAMALGLSRVFWSQAVVAEVYALHNLFVVGIILLLARGIDAGWHVSGHNALAQLGTGGRHTKTAARWPGRFYLLALLLGLSFANHLTTLLLIPAVGLALLFAPPRVGRRSWLVAVGIFGLGLTLYLYIFVRWPMLHDGVWMSLGEFWRYITGQQFGGALHLGAWRADATRYRIVGRLLREAFGWPGLILGGLGLAWLVVKRRRVASITLVTFLAYTWYALSYYVPDVSVFLLPAHLMLALWSGVGMAALLELGGGIARRLGRSGAQRLAVGGTTWGFAVLLSAFALLPLWLGWTNLPRVDQSDAHEAYKWGERVLDLPLAHGSVVLADSVHVAPLYYLQRIEGRRQDLEILVLADEDAYRTTLEASLAEGQAVYLARFLPGLEGVYHLRSVGPLTEVSLAPMLKAPSMDWPLGVRFVGDPDEGPKARITLLGVTEPVAGFNGGTGLTLFWRTDQQVDTIYHVRLRLADDQGRVWWESEGRHPANNYYPTPAWRSGEIVADYHEIPALPPDPLAPAAGYALQVGLFQPFGAEGLRGEAGEQWYTLPIGNVSIPITISEPDRSLRARFTQPGSETVTGVKESVALLGADLPRLVLPGDSVRLRLSWALSEAAGDGVQMGVGPQLSLEWRDRSGRVAAARDLDAWGWSTLWLQAPGSADVYDLWLGLVDPRGDPFTAQCGWLAGRADACALGSVQVGDGDTAAIANFDGKMLLVEASIDLNAAGDGATAAIRPGQTVEVGLIWRGLQSMAEDYTVSVQLVGPDGRLYGQADAWPVQGTHPTSQWQPGQTVLDPYQVTLVPEAPPGGYRVGVVVYLLATQTRLPIVAPTGQISGDIAWIGEVHVAQP